MVSAQVKAEDKEVLVNEDGMPTDEGLKLKHFPTNVELGSHVYKNDAKKLLGEGTEANPTLEKGQLLKIHLRKSKNLPWLTAIADKINDNVMGLETVDSQPYAGGFHFVEHKKNMFSTRKIVLHDKDQNVVAVCLEEKDSVMAFFMRQPKVYHIYGVKPRHEGDTPETDLKEGDQSLFKWARIEDICTHYFYTVSFWSGDNNFQDTFHGEQVKPGIFGGGIGKGVILRLTPTDKDKEMKKKTTHPVAVLIQEKIFNDKSHTTGWEITVGPGLDPVIIVCVAAVLEHLMGANW